MKKLIILLLLFVFAATVKAQKIYVEKTDGGYELPLIDKLIASNYKVTFKKDSSDLTIVCIIGKTGMGRATGSIALTDTKSGNIFVKSKEVDGQTSIFNSYANPKMISMKKIADKYLLDLVKEVLKSTKRD